MSDQHERETLIASFLDLQFGQAMKVLETSDNVWIRNRLGDAYDTFDQYFVALGRQRAQIMMQVLAMAANSTLKAIIDMLNEIAPRT